jgi:hypothetical protein
VATIPQFSQIQIENREKQNSVIETAINLWMDVFVDAINQWMDTTMTNRDRMRVVIPAHQLSGFTQFTTDQRERILNTIKSKFEEQGWLHVTLEEDHDYYDHDYKVVFEQDMNM